MAEQEEELRRLEEGLAAIEKESMLMDQQIEQVTANVEAATEFLEQRHQQTTVLQETRAYRKMLFAEYVEKEQAIASTKENLEDRQRALHEIKDEADEVAKLKAENDATDIDELIAHIDQNRATAASFEAVVAKFANGKAEDDDVKSTTKHLLDEAAARLEATDQELAEETKIHDAKVKELEQHQKSLDEHRACHQAALKIIQDDLAEQTEAEQALQQRLDESHRVAADAIEWGRTLKIFRSGKELHKRMDEKERQAREVAGEN
jgi:chromosome segregation ATPase